MEKNRWRNYRPESFDWDLWADPFWLYDYDWFYDPLRMREISGQRGAEMARQGFRQPYTDVWETDTEVIAAIELPGVDKKDIKVNASDNQVEIKVEKTEEKQQEEQGVYRKQRMTRGFYRLIKLPGNVNTENISATYQNGMLEIRIPKTQAGQASGREVQVA